METNFQKTNPQEEWFVNNTGFDNLGLNFVAPFYIQTNEIQDKDYEYAKVMRALEYYKKHYAKNHNLNIERLDFHFINYGRTELVYVLKNGNDICEMVLIKKQELEWEQ